MRHHDYQAMKFSSLVFCLILGAGCAEGFRLKSVSILNSESSVSPWDKGQANPLAASDYPQALSSSCHIAMTDGMSREEELRVRVYSQGIVQVQVSVNDSDFVDLGTVLGTLTWPGNSFPAATYYLQFRGLRADGSVTACDPASRLVTIYESATVPTPVPPVVVTPPVATPAPPPVTPTPQPPVSPPTTGGGLQGFASLHQYGLRIAKKPNEGSYNYEFYNYVGFKNQYNPDDAMTGCQIGVISAGSCAFPWTGFATVGLNFTESMINYNVPRNFRFFVTTGTTDVRMAGYAPQRTAFAFVMKMAQAPARTRAVTAAEYSSIQANEHIDSSYSRLARGEEILVAHDGGGTVRFLAGKAMSNGGWIFVRQLAISDDISGMQIGQTLYDIQLAVVADKADFIRHYRKMKFDAYGDPGESE